MRVLGRLSLYLSAFFVVTSCSNQSSKFVLQSSDKVILNKEISVSLKSLVDMEPDSVHFYIGKKRVGSSKQLNVKINSSEIGVGNHEVTALVFTSEKVFKVNSFIKVYADKAPKSYSYKLVNTYPHDKKSYTQGLEFHNGNLYETTGRVGKSWLRKVDYKTGEVLKNYDLKDYFGEGMTILKDKIYWLTWQGGKGFVFNLGNFDKISSFSYDESSEGWGLTHDDKNHLIKSDGSNKLYFLNKECKEINEIQATSNKGFVDKLNEIEYVDGKIYANRWITSTPVKSIIVVIDAKTGIVEGVVNLNDLRKEILKEQTLDTDEVLNGIAYNPETKTFFVTGKHWGKLFEIEIVK